MKRDKAFFYLALLTFFIGYISCSKEEDYKVSPSGVKSDLTVSVNDLTISATSGAANFTKLIWTFGDGTTSTDANTTHTYTAGGDYTIQLAAYGSEGAVALKEKKITIVDPRPVSEFSVKQEELTATFTDKSKLATSYLWDFGNGVTSTAANPTATYPEITGTIPKVYTVKLTVTNSKGTSSSTQDITIFPVPIPDFTFTVDKTAPEKDPGRVVTFLNSAVNATSYEWDFGDNTSSTEANVIKTYNIKFSYQVKLTAINNRRKVSVTKTVNLN